MESSSARDSKAVDIIGHYDPLIKEGKKFVLNVEKYQHWHSHGAQPSERVEKLYNLEING
jgi:small subunit ribosomal protein S16